MDWDAACQALAEEWQLRIEARLRRERAQHAARVRRLRVRVQAEVHGSDGAAVALLERAVPRVAAPRQIRQLRP